MTDRDYQQEEKELRETAAEEEINTAKLNCEMQKQEIMHKFGQGILGRIAYPDQYAQIGIAKAKNGFILTYSCEKYVFTELKQVFLWIEAFYNK